MVVDDERPGNFASERKTGSSQTIDQADALEQAQTYLDANRDLKRSLGLSEDATFTVKPLGMGEHNINYRFRLSGTNDEYVLRVNVTPQPFHNDQVKYEYDALVSLKMSEHTPTPYYVDDSHHTLGKGVLVTSFCKGRQLDFDDLHKGDLSKIAHIMAHVHSVPVCEQSSIRRVQNPLEALFKECKERIEVYLASSVCELRLIGWMERFMKSAAQELNDYSFDPKMACIVNTEPLSSSFLLNDAPDNTDNIGWFLDWERPILGDIAEDIAFFLAPTSTFWESNTSFTQDQVNSFIEAYWTAIDGRISTKGFEQRYNAWQKMVVIRALAWCLRAQAQYAADPNLHRTQRAARLVPMYLSEGYLEDLWNSRFKE